MADIIIIAPPVQTERSGGLSFRVCHLWTKMFVGIALKEKESEKEREREKKTFFL